MGKKRKSTSLAKDEDNKRKTEDANILDNKKIETNSKTHKKVKKQENSNAMENTEDISGNELQIEESLNTKSKNKNNGKMKLKKSPLDGDNTKSLHLNQNISSKRATKIRFVDDAPQEVASGSVQQSTDAAKKKDNQSVKLDEEEEEVNDEDIDKFCDELTEEDNAQFDNWVKLIEAKLHSKKK
ncbi:hypothetical protein ABMA27_005108 [Loxostege sticticalis]|uniref:Uncharacterized protein n=1 Tax=Loxostege sticticalis TaxID=481309 RepID=A0ABR3HLU4_LOXSC